MGTYPIDVCLIAVGGNYCAIVVYRIAHATLLWTKPALHSPQVNSCGQIVVTVGSDRKLYLDFNEHCSLENPDELLWRLQQIFDARIENHVYRAVPEEEWIVKMIIVKAARDLSYGEITDLLSQLKEVGANPIALLSE
jgi:biopolymer transport protein ExbD